MSGLRFTVQAVAMVGLGKGGGSGSNSWGLPLEDDDNQDDSHVTHGTFCWTRAGRPKSATWETSHVQQRGMDAGLPLLSSHVSHATGIQYVFQSSGKLLRGVG